MPVIVRLSGAFQVLADDVAGSERVVGSPKTPEAIAEALTQELARPVTYRPVPVDGARRAAALIAELV